MSDIFIYANADTLTLPMEGSDGTDCGAYICADMDGTTGLDLYVERPPGGAVGGILAEPRTAGYPNVDGLYYIRAQNILTPGDFVYQVTNGFHGTPVGQVTVTWEDDLGSLCPLWPATPPPTLTAAEVTAGILLNWTASVSADSRFWSIEYDVERKVDTGSFAFVTFLHNTLTYTDTDISTGHTYIYRILGREPVIGGGNYSNQATITPGGAVGAIRASWGIIAR